MAVCDFVRSPILCFINAGIYPHAQVVIEFGHKLFKYCKCPVGASPFGPAQTPGNDPIRLLVESYGLGLVTCAGHNI